jgi:proline dehydrogenase
VLCRCCALRCSPGVQFPTIYNTYQCYLRDSYSRVCIDMERARRGGFWFAAKAVRGAYIVSERARAVEKGYPDPVFGDIEQTHTNYHRVVDYLLQNIDHADIMVATHNESTQCRAGRQAGEQAPQLRSMRRLRDPLIDPSDGLTRCVLCAVCCVCCVRCAVLCCADTVRYVTRRMEELGVHGRGGRVFFGQLLGMCDHVSFSLGDAGYAAYKYVPYGPIKEVIPYLIRRAQENSSVLQDSGIVKERRLIYDELIRRTHM